MSGVLLISHTGREHARIDWFYIDPEFQNRGIGGKVITIIEEMYPMVNIWTLDTIQKSIRNHYFYEKNGYEKIGETEEERYYCKTIGDSINLGFQEEKIPLTMERCELINSKIIDSNLQNLSIDNCNIEGMTIDGLLVSDLINVYNNVAKDNCV